MLSPAEVTNIDAIERVVRMWTEWHGAWRFALVFVAVFAAASLARRIIFRGLGRLAARAEGPIYDALLTALRRPALYWVILLALVTAVADLDEADVPHRIAHAFSVAILVLLTISMALALARLTIVLMQHSFRRSAASIRITTLTRTLVYLFWGIPALLLVLHSFGFEVTPALATLGVGGIAISLALKDTLANLFAGFYVSLSGQLDKGDYIHLDSGAEGYVVDIHWRVTTLRTSANNLVLIPNSKLAEAIVTNYSQPAKQLTASIAYSVHYDTDLELLDRAVLEEARSAVGLVAGVTDQPAPQNLLMPGFGESSLDFTLLVGVTQQEDERAVADYLRRRLLERFRKDGIRIPYPTRSIEPPPAGKDAARNDEPENISS